MLSIDEIRQFIQDDAASDKKMFAKKGQAYYEADHDIKQYRLFYYNADGNLVEDTTRSNIKISHPFFTELVDQCTQYILSGKDGFIKSDIPELQTELDSYFNENEDFTAELSEVLTGCQTKGFEYMYAYKNAEGRLSFMCADSIGVIEIRAKDTDDNTEYVIYWYIDRIEKWHKKIKRIQVWDKENTYFYYNAEDFNNEIKVNIMVDCGNWNYDCVCDNVLNWYGNSGDGSIDKESSMLWLAKTQGKATALRKACKQVHRDDGYYVDRDKNKDKFIESCIQEFENLPSHMATVTFLVKMSLFELFDLIELQNKEYDEKGKYDPRKNEKSKSYIVLGKETMCGLYDSWSGGGSVLEVELDKDVKLPIKYAIFCVEGCKMHGYDIDEVYGLIDSCWKETVKEIKEVA